MKTVRVVVVGAGSMANAVHYPSLASLEGVDVVALCDLDPARRDATAEKYAIPGRYADWRAMVDDTDPDAVVAIGQPHQLIDVWTGVLQRGRNLFVEKPLGLTLHQARSLAWLAEKHGCVTQVGFQRRACPMVAQLRDACLERGPIVHATCEFVKCAPEPMVGARDHMMDDGVHAIDTLRWLCGGEVVKVESVARRIGTPDINFFTALLRFDNGAVGVLVNSWTSGRRIFRVSMHAPGICAEAEHEREGFLYADGDTAGVRFDTKVVAGSDDLFVYGGFRARHAEFVDAIRAGTLPSSHFGDAVKTMEVAERILAQHLLEG